MKRGCRKGLLSLDARLLSRLVPSSRYDAPFRDRFQLLLPISPSKSSGGRLPGDVEEVKPERGIF